jgi:hypothetical protein
MEQVNANTLYLAAALIFAAVCVALLMRWMRHERAEGEFESVAKKNGKRGLHD